MFIVKIFYNTKVMKTMFEIELDTSQYNLVALMNITYVSHTSSSSNFICFKVPKLNY